MHKQSLSWPPLSGAGIARAVLLIGQAKQRGQPSRAKVEWARQTAVVGRLGRSSWHGERAQEGKLVVGE